MSSRARSALAAAVGLLLATTLGACSDDEPAEPAPTTPTATPTPPPAATAVPAPSADACYRLSYRQAVSPTNGARAVPCRRPHTAETFAVGELDNVVAGHLLAVDSERVQTAVATTCPERLGDFVGGSLDDQRLSMLRAVWFTPSLERSAAGASWFRCDVVASAGAESLIELTGSLRQVLDDEEGRERYAMCGTTSPDADDFERVPCAGEHSWRAISVVDLGDGEFPGRDAVTDAAAGCEDDAEAQASDALDYRWSAEGPNAEQWATGQTFVRCWMPEADR
ncbi:septum formation family protein [Nocardioides sp. C4-1]|uniref:septum formation family protein n=1 Tax=Nocardioides sp. C4-1 TaxID=3151851 RepID=UPI003263E37E